jgi:hypothetical protein
MNPVASNQPGGTDNKNPFAFLAYRVIKLLNCY